MIKQFLAAFTMACLAACASPNFMSDGPPVQITTETPDYFELPARIGLVRLVDSQASAAGVQESAMWDDLAQRAGAVGTFHPLVPVGSASALNRSEAMIAAAREQRFDYLLVIAMTPVTGTADIMVLHVGSGGLMATGRATSAQGGQRGFWGNRIRNPARLERVTRQIAQAARPEVEAILQGMMARQP